MGRVLLGFACARSGELADTVVQVVIGGGIVFAIGVWLGQIGAG